MPDDLFNSYTADAEKRVYAMWHAKPDPSDPDQRTLSQIFANREPDTAS